ncbi:hypothetical protein GW17_00049247 [Ensete ventricosum]|nr:hypothetical protein GW17_00049247 [Ensete ventricosum]
MDVNSVGLKANACFSHVKRGVLGCGESGIWGDASAGASRIRAWESKVAKNVKSGRSVGGFKAGVAFSDLSSDVNQETLINDPYVSRNCVSLYILIKNCSLLYSSTYVVSAILCGKDFTSLSEGPELGSCLHHLSFVKINELNITTLRLQVIQAPMFGKHKPDPKSVASIILGGGPGAQLFPLTSTRATPAVRNQPDQHLG